MNHQIESLLIEREGYVRRGLKDRVTQVDDALAALGYKSTETATAEPRAERAAKPAPRKRAE